MSSCPLHTQPRAHQSREVVDRNDCASLADALGVHLDGGLGERGVDIVDGDGVVRVGGTTCQLVHSSAQSSCSLARNVDDDGQPSRLSGLGHEFRRDEFGNRLREVDAVDKDVDWESARIYETMSHHRGPLGKVHPWRSLPCPI